MTDEHGILVENVWKKFHRGQLHDSLRDLVPALFSRLLGPTGRRERHKDDFWALRDISFEVKPGDTLGIIGPNGAGKSTLLKTITRIMRPNRGRVTVRGRIGALIEIAAGFHPDLTGRENVFLQGAIMGMRKSEIARKFDDIVDFSGISEFIDTPVKRFSSGMNARLGFSIAAYLDPDILLIDEVLSVGDFIFQRQAFDHLAMMAKKHIPVVVVSHQLDKITSLCSSVILLDRGEIIAQGPARHCVAAYLKLTPTNHSTDDAESPIRITSFRSSLDRVVSGKWVQLRIKGLVVPPGPSAQQELGFRIRALPSGEVVFATGGAARGKMLPSAGPVDVVFELQMNVRPGLYSAESLVYDHNADRALVHGPTVQVQVTDGIGFFGPVQMNMEVTVRNGIDG